ncbi:MAG: Coenzyme F420 hydrogenase/dehydrogenase, beta subunit C-terminal domain [Pseudomonadota bacterium]
MAKTVTVDVKDRDLLGALRGFLTAVLAQEEISAILVPWRLPMKNVVMPTLVTDPALMDRADPLAPAFPINGAKLASRLTRKASGGRIAAVMRPCEIRAFTELVKLKQGSAEDLVIIGIDCLGAFDNSDFTKWAEENNGDGSQRFAAQVLAGETTGPDLAPACRICEFPVASGADISVALYGVDTGSRILAIGQSAAGDALLSSLGLADAKTPPAREQAVTALVDGRITARDRLFAETREATDDLEKLTGYLAGCVNCYNCRVACPVCYCKECVFVTDVFNHEPLQYLRWAERKGAVKMPTDTVFYHLTRLAHMSTACVGCGQCSNACPNDIPVMELFRTAAHAVQAAFNYEAGRSPEEKPPLSEFREKEFEEVVGMA